VIWGSQPLLWKKYWNTRWWDNLKNGYFGFAFYFVLLVRKSLAFFSVFWWQRHLVSKFTNILKKLISLVETWESPCNPPFYRFGHISIVHRFYGSNFIVCGPPKDPPQYCGVAYILLTGGVTSISVGQACIGLQRLSNLSIRQTSTYVKAPFNRVPYKDIENAPLNHQCKISHKTYFLQHLHTLMQIKRHWLHSPWLRYFSMLGPIFLTYDQKNAQYRTKEKHLEIKVSRHFIAYGRSTLTFQHASST